MVSITGDVTGAKNSFKLDQERFKVTKGCFNNFLSSEISMKSILAKVAMLTLPIIGTIVLLETAFEIVTAPIHFVGNWMNPKISEEAETSPISDDGCSETSEEEVPMTVEEEIASLRSLNPHERLERLFNMMNR